MIDDNDDGYDYHDGYDKFFLLLYPYLKWILRKHQREVSLEQLSIYLFIYLSIYLFIHISIHLSIYHNYLSIISIYLYLYYSCFLFIISIYILYFKEIFQPHQNMPLNLQLIMKQKMWCSETIMILLWLCMYDDNAKCIVIIMMMMVVTMMLIIMIIVMMMMGNWFLSWWSF